MASSRVYLGVYDDTVSLLRSPHWGPEVDDIVLLVLLPPS